MFLESFQVQGFKSLADVTLTDLSMINVFHGLNDTGKSNLLEALDLFSQIMPLALNSADGEVHLSPTDLHPYTRDLFRLQNAPPRTVVWTARLRLTTKAASFALRLKLTDAGSRELAELESDYRLEIAWPERQPDEDVLNTLSSAASGFHRIPATRYFQTERLGPAESSTTGQARRSPVTAGNLKRTLVEAYAGLNDEKSQRYDFLVQALEKHFDLPGFIARLSPGGEARQLYVVGFRRPGMKEPLLIENIGSGVQQLILLLGQMLFNPARSVGIEEPEMNLSPKDWQGKLMAIFRELVDSQTLDQIFITSHSPEFEMEPGFWDVTYENGATRVSRSTALEKYFPAPVAETTGEELGPHLNSLGQIRLPDRVVADLGLQRRDPVFFSKTHEGYWRLRTRAEVLSDLKVAEEEAEYDTENSAG